jgi:hypothetical protein
MKLGKPQEILTFSNHIVGATTSHASQQTLVVANYAWQEFWGYGIEPREGTLNTNLEWAVGNSPKATFDGGIYAPLWNEVGARAQVGQVDNLEQRLLYLKNGGSEIGVARFADPLTTNKNTLTPEPSLTGIQGEKIDYFIIMRNGNLATIEDFNNPTLRVYSNEGDQLNLIGEQSLAFLTYGLSQPSDNELMVVVPTQGTYPLNTKGEPGVYRVPLINDAPGTLQRDTDFDKIELPADIRGLGPVFDDESLAGYVTTTYGFTRERKDMGNPSKLFYIPVEK